MATSPMEKVTNNNDYDTTNTKGYCKMPDGTLICYGDVTKSAGHSNVAFYFAESFMDTDYAMTVEYKTISGELCDTAIWKAEKNRAYIYCANTSDQKRFTYIAIGRWK